jgi:hypothetical protein
MGWRLIDAFAPVRAPVRSQFPVVRPALRAANADRVVAPLNKLFITLLDPICPIVPAILPALHAGRRILGARG